MEQFKFNNWLIVVVFAAFAFFVHMARSGDDSVVFSESRKLAGTVEKEKSFRVAIDGKLIPKDTLQLKLKINLDATCDHGMQFGWRLPTGLKLESGNLNGSISSAKTSQSFERLGERPFKRISSDCECVCECDGNLFASFDSHPANCDLRSWTCRKSF